MLNTQTFSPRNLVQELYELGVKGAAFRVGRELSRRSGVAGLGSVPQPVTEAKPALGGSWTAHLPFPEPIFVADAVRDRISGADLLSLSQTANRATLGEIECFGRWRADFGDPVDWYGDPQNRLPWNPSVPWTRALMNEHLVGDVKLTWEVARFPHAYHMARAAAFAPSTAPVLARALAAQITDFVERNPHGYGIHWASGQEVAFRLLAWLFCADTLLLRTEEARAVEPVIHDALLHGAAYIADNLNYARLAVYNNHLLSEALALFAVGVMLPHIPQARRWRDLGRDVLAVEARRQFYPDGGYIQQSHNYHRVALQDLLWACAFSKSMGDRPLSSWLEAMDRSIDFLVAHQNPADGRLPNYGGNDGAMPGIFSTCDYGDFRPVLQAASVIVRDRRLYEPGPWDEMTAWFLGPAALDAPLAHLRRSSVSFSHTGYHVLRGRDEGNFAAFRCGSLLERFSQIDMLHLDVWWRGLNVLVDPGSFQYNAETTWHEHFMRTASHNTIVADGRDQMVHYRQFKVLYWTKARLLQFRDDEWSTHGEGEHDGYRRHPGACVHRRSILFVKDDLWIVVDHLDGDDEHDLRLHWLGGEFPWTHTDRGMELATPQGSFSVAVFDNDGRLEPSSVVAGVEDPPRGWLSRYYGEKVAVPSMVVERRAWLPVTLVSVLSGAPYTTSVEKQRWTIRQGERQVRFSIGAGRIGSPSVQ
jgi:hypothetical protein